MSKWKRQLDSYYSILEEISKKQGTGQTELKFDRAFVIASDIAEQYFCEKKVEMQYVHGRIETEEKTIGTMAHEKLLEDSAKIKKKDLLRKIYGKKKVFALEMLLLARYKDVILAGRPDSGTLQNGYPCIVFEYKFSKSRTAYMTHHVQAETYGVLLKNMGFDTSQLFHAIITADPETRHDGQLKKRVVNAVAMNGPKEAVLELEDAAIHFHKFNEVHAEEDLNWAIEFWKKSREAVLPTNPNKCRNCEYKVQCQKT